MSWRSAPHPRDWISRTASFGCGVALLLAAALVVGYILKEFWM